MPSSSELVATTARSVPSLSICSVMARSSLDTDPWCARAITLGALPATSVCFISCAGSRRVSGESESGSCSSAYSSLSRLVTRSAVRREFTKTSVERCSMTWVKSSVSINGQMDFAVGSSESAATGSASAIPSGSSNVDSPMVEPGSGVGRSDMSSTGTRTDSSQRLSAGGAMISTGRPPLRKLATDSSGRTVADSPMRWKEPASRSRRSRVSARCTPRFVPARAWISSIMTVSTLARTPAAWEVSMR